MPKKLPAEKTPSPPVSKKVLCACQNCGQEIDQAKPHILMRRRHEYEPAQCGLSTRLERDEPVITMETTVIREQLVRFHLGCFPTLSVRDLTDCLDLTLSLAPTGAP